MTLSVNQISDGVKAVVDQYPIKKVTLFGSYANGSFDENSDVDLLVEFKTENVSLLLLSKLKYEMEDRLGKDVDIIHGPLDDNAMIEIDKEIPIYESQRLYYFGKTKRAVCMTVINIGELVKNITDDTRKKYHDVPWKYAAGFRDIAAHKYQTLKMGDVYSTVINDFPQLRKQLTDILSSEEDERI